MAKILLKYKDSLLKEISLDKDELTIGRRPDNDVHIDNPAVSGLHAKIIKEEEGKYIIEDQNSTNGTLVNGRRITKALLSDGDDITVGKHDIVFEMPQAEVVAASHEHKKVHTSDETVILDSKVQDEIISKALEQKPEGAPASAAAAAEPAKEIVGGFMVIEGDTGQSEYELKDRISSIGKDKNATIKLSGFFAPKVAALVNRKKDGYYINATDSKKAPQVNGKDVVGRYKLRDGDIVKVAKVKLQFFVKE